MLTERTLRCQGAIAWESLSCRFTIGRGLDCCGRVIDQTEKKKFKLRLKQFLVIILHQLKLKHHTMGQAGSNPGQGPNRQNKDQKKVDETDCFHC